ncbi:MAG TPA: vWA domain-containing protein, partial [bacterium]
MTHFDLKIHSSIILFLLIFAFLIGLSIYVYRWTIPPVPRWLKRTLAILRMISLIIILFILFEPILNLSWNRTEKPIVAVLLDNSASMTLKDNGEARADKAKAIVRSDLFQKSSKDKSFDFFQFSQTLAPLSLNNLDSISFNNDGTDLTRSLEILQERNIDRYLTGVVLITDGINNLGDNPVRFVADFDTPIFPIAVGNSEEQKDVVLSKIAANQVTYVNNKVPVEISLQAFGYQNQKIEVHLQQGVDVLDSKIIDIENNIFETRVQLNFTPKQPGFSKYSVRIPALEDELTALNNQKNFYTKVLQSKMKILFIAGGPSADLKFLKKNLEADPNIEISFWIIKKNQEFYKGPFSAAPQKLMEYDCIVLQDFPTKNIPQDIMPGIKKVLETKQTPLLFIAGNGVHYPSLSPLSSYLPMAAP